MTTPLRRARRLAPLIFAAWLAAISAAAADSMARLAEGERVLRLGYRTDAAPFSSEADGAPTGFTIALCEAIAGAVAAEIGAPPIETQWTAVSVASRFDALRDGRIDLLCGATTASDDRRAVMAFTLLTYQTDGAVLVDAKAFAAEAWGERIGVLGATTSRTVVEKLLTDSGMDFAELTIFETRGAGVDALRVGEIDSFFGDRALLAAIAAAEPQRYVLADTSFSAEPYAIALRLGDDALRAVANTALRRLYRSGEIERLHESFFRRSPPDALKALYRREAEAAE